MKRYIILNNVNLNRIKKIRKNIIDTNMYDILANDNGGTIFL